MDGTYSQQRKAISRKRRRNRKRKGGIDELSDDMLINILSRVSMKEAARTSVLARRWKNLWMFAFRTLEFDDKDTATGTVMKSKKFISWVNAVLQFHQPQLIDGLVIRLSKISRRCRSTSAAIESWVYFAMQKEAQRFELDLSRGRYNFPDIDKLLSHSREVHPSFRSLRSLRLVAFDVKDEVVQYFLASCPHLEQLCIRTSYDTKNLKVVDPPKLKVLAITGCHCIQRLEVSAANLVSLAYEGGKNSLLVGKLPNLRELTLGEDLCDSFIFEPNAHSSYPVQQLEKLGLILRYLIHGRAIAAPPPDLPQLCSLKRLELQVFSLVDRSLLFFTSLINASPQLREFKIKISYMVIVGPDMWDLRARMPYPAVGAADVVEFVHENLELVEMAGYIGCSSEEKLLVQLFKIAPFVKRVVIDTESDYNDDSMLAILISAERRYRVEYDAMHRRDIGATTKFESIERAERLVSTFPREIEYIIM